ncbi:MAG: hypothetical protein HC787_07910 [Nostocaceae cyanobacterium CSU_2_110]|nr:hypothetical protein [Nostocaceae cyanobacterium CSU_2_110]
MTVDSGQGEILTHHSGTDVVLLRLYNSSLFFSKNTEKSHKYHLLLINIPEANRLFL